MQRTVELVTASEYVIANDRRTADRCVHFAKRTPDHVWWSPSNVPPPEPTRQIKATGGLVTTFGQINSIKSFREVHRGLASLRKRIPSLRWQIVGPFSPERDPDHAVLAKDLKDEWVTFWGSAADLGDPHLQTALARTECMILPFVDGASPRRTTLQTAWAFGLPVVTTLPPVPEPAIIDGTNCLLVTQDAPDAWERTIEQVLTRPELRSRLQQGATETAQRFSWENLATKHLALYDAALGIGSEGRLDND
jgi:glycosyltransferase involved in cell wall biosynthesis